MLRFLIMQLRGFRPAEAAGDDQRAEGEVALPLPATQSLTPAAGSPFAAPLPTAEWALDQAKPRPSMVAHRVLPLLLAACCLPVPACTCFRKQGQDANVVAARQLSLRGIDAQQCGKWQEAEVFFADALRQNPADERAHCHYAQVMWQRGQQAAAIRHQEESVRLSGGDPQQLVRLGEMYLSLGNVPAAWECAGKALEANHRLACAWALQGDVYRRQRSWDQALESYHRTLTEQPHFPHVQLACAEIYRELNRPRRALATLDALESQLRPQAAPAELYFQQGLAYKALGRYQDAVDRLTVASQRMETSADVLFHLAEAQLMMGNSASAQLAVNAALHRSPSHPHSLALQQSIDQQILGMTAAVKR
jgi:tetratricopeptide (TPR) repeat protein